jgi:surface polysaccharide O-acyltransferase-like enzyme
VTTSPTKRLYFVDYLRVALTVLVIAHHAGQAYGTTGGTWPVFESLRSALLSPFFAVNAMFFMGLFFLVSGYFVPLAYDRKGAAAFLKGRLVRLGIPILFFGLFVFSPIAYSWQPGRPSLTEFVRYLYRTGWQELYMHLWFLVHLLMYSIGYVVWRQLAQRVQRYAKSEPTGSNPRLPTHGMILLFVVALTLIGWVVRIKYPLDRWVPILILIAEPAHLPQYIGMFVIGILSYRGDWLRRLPTNTGMIWLAIGLAAAAGYYAYDLVGTRPLSQIIAKGGKDWRSLVFCTWEAFVCVGLGVGLLVLFREWLNRAPSKLMAAIVRAQYGAYIFHLLVVLGVQTGLATVLLSPFPKFVLATFTAAVLSFGLGHLARQLPGVNKIL